jgi:aspartate/tyrosine/aromatic aminotransferase
VGGTSALFIAGELLAKHVTRQIYLPNLTWANHAPVFQHAHMDIAFYPYADLNKQLFDFEAMCHSIEQMPKGSAILLHVNCHNPTGIDPHKEQWRQLSTLIRKRAIFPLFDLAYQGFGGTPQEDVYPLHLFAEEGYEMCVAVSCAKNFGLYGERVGMLALICQTADISRNVNSYLKQSVRSSYSNPPLQGSRIVSTILHDSHLTQIWLKELASMRERIQAMRIELATKLNRGNYLIEQRGMFSCLGLNEAQISFLRDKYAVYLVENGRLNIAGLNARNIDHVADALRTSLHTSIG